MERSKHSLENTQIVKAEEISLSSMDLQQQRMAERLYSQLGLDPVVEKVLKEYNTNLRGMDRATDKVFGPFDVKGRAESVAKVSALMTYSALHQQYTKELDQMQDQMSEVASQRDRERANYDTLVQKVADVVGGDYEQLKSNYEDVVDRLSDVEHLKLQTVVLNQEKNDIVQRYESQLADLQREKSDVAQRYESQLADLQREKSDVMQRYEGQIAVLQQERTDTAAKYENEIKTLREEHGKAADDLRAQIAERGERIDTLEEEKTALTGERDDYVRQLEALRQAHADLEARYAELSGNHDRLRTAGDSLENSVTFEEIRKRVGVEMHTFVLNDSKVPDAVIDGVGKFIDFKRYFGLAAESGAREAVKQAVMNLSQA